MSHKTHPVEELLISLGTDAEIGQKIGEGAHVPRDWRRRKSIPLTRWPSLYSLGVTSEQLLLAHDAAETAA